MSLSKMPLPVWILTLAAFAIGTAEFVIAGILTQVAETLDVSEGQAGNLITAYALAIVIGGPILTLWLARYDKKLVLVGLMALFIVGNLIAAFTTDYHTLLASRVLAGLTQGPFYGIGAWIGNAAGWNTTFLVVAGLGLLATLAIMMTIKSQGRGDAVSVRSQLAVFRNRQLWASLLITVLGWVGFMTFYGYIAPIAEQVAGLDRHTLTWVLVIVGLGLVIGNSLGGKSADANLRLSLIAWPAAMIVALLVVGLVAANPWAFVASAFVFGITAFANVPPMQMQVMRHGAAAPELAATANISAFNIANALGGILGGVVVDSDLGAAAIPFAAAVVPVAGLLFILTQRGGRPLGVLR